MQRGYISWPALKHTHYFTHFAAYQFDLTELVGILTNRAIVFIRNVHLNMEDPLITTGIMMFESHVGLKVGGGGGRRKKRKLMT